MEQLNQNPSDDIINLQELNEDINDIGLPKSSLNSFVKEILQNNKVRGDKNIIPMLDKISRLYVTYISSLGAKICTECGKKTLNLEHIFQALREMKLKKHLEQLEEHIEGKKIDNIKDELLEDNKKNENLKNLVNKKKKKGGKKKNCFEDEGERERMKQMQEQMFLEARESMNTPVNDIKEKEDEKNNNNQEEAPEKDKKDDKEKQKNDNYHNNMFINNCGEEDINFD